MPTTKAQRNDFILPIYNTSSLHRRELVTEAVETWIDENPNKAPTSQELVAICHKIIEANFQKPPLQDTGMAANTVTAKHETKKPPLGIKILEIDDGKNWARRNLILFEKGLNVNDKSVELARLALGITINKAR